MLFACTGRSVWIDLGLSIGAAAAIFISVAVAATFIGYAIHARTNNAPTPHGQATSNDGNGKGILDSAIDYLKTTTSLVTGSLLFSIAFLLPNSMITCGMHSWLIAASLLLAFSTACGLLAQSGLLGMLADRIYNLDDLGYAVPASVHMFTFVAAAASIALSIFFGDERPSLDSITVRNSQQAVVVALKAFDAINGSGSYRMSRVVSDDLSKGVDPNDARDLNWHVQIEISTTSKTRQPPRYLDVFIDSVSGNATVVPKAKRP